MKLKEELFNKQTVGTCKEVPILMLLICWGMRLTLSPELSQAIRLW